MLPKPLPPIPPQTQASPQSLPAMNNTASKNAVDGTNGTASCSKPVKSWFAVILTKVDEKGQETHTAASITLDLKIPDLGEIQRITAAGPKPIIVTQLTPGGTGDVLKMTHLTDVFEAIGDFS